MGCPTRKLANASVTGNGTNTKKPLVAIPCSTLISLVLVAAAEFQIVLAANPAQRSGVIEYILVGIPRAGDGIAHRRIAIHLDERRPGGNIETGLVLEPQAGWGLMILVLAKEELVAQEGESRHTDEGWRKGVRFLCYEVLRPLVFADREARHAGAARRKRIHLGELVEHVAEVQRIVRSRDNDQSLHRTDRYHCSVFASLRTDWCRRWEAGRSSAGFSRLS